MATDTFVQNKKRSRTAAQLEIWSCRTFGAHTVAFAYQLMLQPNSPITIGFVFGIFCLRRPPSLSCFAPSLEHGRCFNRVGEGCSRRRDCHLPPHTHTPTRNHTHKHRHRHRHTHALPFRRWGWRTMPAKHDCPWRAGPAPRCNRPRPSPMQPAASPACRGE